MFDCQICNSSFENLAACEAHIEIHEGEKFFFCVGKNCREVFSESTNYFKHLNETHTDLEYSCEFGCSRSFSDLDNLALHQKVHRWRNTKKSKGHLKCERCFKTFATLIGLEHHLKVEGNHNHKCDLCGKSLNCLRSLKRHVETFHTESSEHQCEKCEKKFKTPQSLRVHQAIHSDITFECDVCEAKFNRKDRLKRHKLVHNEDNRIKCPFAEKTGCEQTFFRKDKVKEHVVASHSE